MACQNNNCEPKQAPKTFDYITLIVLYILLAIILGATIW